jgi:hypothetical protein
MYDMRNIQDIKENIYITSDEYIGLSYYLDGNLVRKGVIDDKEYWKVRKDYKKIILTTDQDLIKDGVQAIDDDFLEWFVKNPSCEEVEVVSAKTIPALQLTGNGHCWWKIIIPKEEAKQGTMSEAIKQVISNQLKQETPKEIAERYYEDEVSINGFINGYKLAQEQILGFLYEEITERRDYSASKMCEKIIEFIK